MTLDIKLFHAKYQSEQSGQGEEKQRSCWIPDLRRTLCPLEQQSDEAFISVSLLQSQTSEISTVSSGKHTPLPVRTIVSVMQANDTQGVPHHRH